MSVSQGNSKINKWTQSNLQAFIQDRKTDKMKIQLMDSEKISANDVTDKGLISKINRQLIYNSVTNKQPN